MPNNGGTEIKTISLMGNDAPEGSERTAWPTTHTLSSVDPLYVCVCVRLV